MMKFYLFMIMLIFNIKFINSLYIIMYMYMMLLLMLFLMIFVNYNDYYMNIYYWMGMDSLSYSLIMLSIFIISMMYFISMNIFNKKMFSLLLLILLLSLMLSFNSMNYFLFYLFFEISLIPTFILIMMFGYQPERLNASMYMLLYTLFASLPLLMILFYLFNEFNSMNYFYMNFIKLNYINEILFYMYMIFAFLVKLPMFMFHMWLPKAHVEAPVSGSMILAGVMLKLGGYGLIRAMNMMLNLCIKYNMIFISLNLIGMINLSILCLRQNDLKVMVAYSSVVHMSMMLCSLMTLYLYGKFSSIFLMIGHGFCSPALFILVNYIYIRSKTRNMYINKGLINLFPSMMLWWFMFCMANMAAPITLNLIGELMIIISLMNWLNKIMILLILGMFFSASYSIYLFCSVYHGMWFNSMKYIFNNNIMEYKLMFMLWLPLNMMILKLDMFI